MEGKVLYPAIYKKVGLRLNVKNKNVT